MKESLLVSCLLATGILTACNSGGSSNDNGGGDNGFQQWTTQIGGDGTDGLVGRITYDPVKNLVYRDYENEGNSVVCMVSGSASSSTPWDCSTLNDSLPNNTFIGSSNVVTDLSGNVYAFGIANDTPSLLKYDGGSWTSYPLTGTPSTDASNAGGIYYYNGNVYGITSSSSVNGVTSNLVGYTTTGAYVNTINNVYTGTDTITYANAPIYNGRIYINDYGKVQSTNLSNTSDIHTYANIPSSSGLSLGITVNSSGIIACSNYGIYSNSLSNSGWSKIGYTYQLQSIYMGCVYAASKGNKALVMGYTSSSGVGNSAMYIQP